MQPWDIPARHGFAATHLLVILVLQLGGVVANEGTSSGPGNDPGDGYSAHYVFGSDGLSIGAQVPMKVEDSDGYDAFSIAFEAANGDLLIVGRRGADHHRGGDIFLWRSRDGAFSWSTGRFLYESGADDRNVGGGVASTGTIVLFSGEYDGSTVNTLYAHRSSDHGYTISTADITSILPPSNSISAHGRMVETADGTLLQTVYGRRESERRLWLIASDDDGNSWSLTGTIYAGEDLVTEATLHVVDGTGSRDTRLISVSRVNGDRLRQFVSSDGGITWTEQGELAVSTKFAITPDLLGLRDGRVMLAWAERGRLMEIRYAVADAESAFDSPGNWGNPTELASQNTVLTAYESHHRATVSEFGYPMLLRAGDSDENLLVVFNDGTTPTDTDLRQEPVDIP